MGPSQTGPILPSRIPRIPASESNLFLSWRGRRDKTRSPTTGDKQTGYILKEMDDLARGKPHGRPEMLFYGFLAVKIQVGDSRDSGPSPGKILLMQDALNPSSPFHGHKNYRPPGRCGAMKKA